MSYKCALLAHTADGWFTDSLFACPRLVLYALSEKQLGLKKDSNPYNLPLLEKPDAILIDTYWHQWLEAQGEACVDRVYSRLRSICDVLVGIEGHDPVRLALSPAGIDRIDILLKSQGVYRDRELYNFEVGPYYPGANWTRKTRKAKLQYSSTQLDKIRLSFPAFLAMDAQVRNRVRKIKPGVNLLQRYVHQYGDFLNSVGVSILDWFVREPPFMTHCLGTLSHIQRLELLLYLRELGFTGDLGISLILPRIGGTEYLDDALPQSELETIKEIATGNGLYREPLNRYAFQRNMLRHKTIFAPTGYGEMPLRMAEAWQVGRAVICQDMSHVEVMYPFRENENIIFCRHDFSDVEEIFNRVQSGRIDYLQIGKQGKRDWLAWSADLPSVYKKGVTDHIEALQ